MLLTFFAYLLTAYSHLYIVYTPLIPNTTHILLSIAIWQLHFLSTNNKCAFPFFTLFKKRFWGKNWTVILIICGNFFMRIQYKIVGNERHIFAIKFLVKNDHFLQLA